MPSLGSTEGNITGRKNNKQLNPQIRVRVEPNGNSPSGEAVQTPAPATGKWGLGREARAALFRVRIGSEFPEANQSKLIWASKLDCGTATMGKALRHCQACAQNKGLNRTSRLQTIPFW